MSNVNWLNPDGLYVKFGTNEGAVGHAGEYKYLGPTRLVECSLGNLVNLTSSSVVQDYNVWLPKGAFIESVTIEVTTAATSGGAATLSVNALNTTDFATSLGTLVNAAALATLNAAGDRIILTAGSTGAGNLIGTVLSADAVFAASYGTAAFTAGAIEIRVEVSYPAT